MAIRIVFKGGGIDNAYVEYLDTDTGHTNIVSVTFDLMKTASYDTPQVKAMLLQQICNAVNADNGTPGKATYLDILY